MPGAALASHNAVDFISFTGSPVVGQQVQKLAADHFIPCTLELGGKSPHLVFEDADFDAAVPIICRAIIQNTGQTLLGRQPRADRAPGLRTVRRAARRGLREAACGAARR